MFVRVLYFACMEDGTLFHVYYGRLVGEELEDSMYMNTEIIQINFEEVTNNTFQDQGRQSKED